jgi:hypothetical protein
VIRRLFVFGWVLAGVGGIFAACSSDPPKASSQRIPDRVPRDPRDPDADPDAAGPSAKASPESYAQGLCAFYEKCDPGYFLGEFATAEACRTRMLGYTGPVLSARGSAATQADVDACIAKLGVGSCADDLAQLPACEFHGTLADGETCSFAAQCRSGSCFYPAVDGGFSDCGKCTPRVPVNSDCTNAECAAGFICVANRCLKPGEVNEPCDDINVPCRRYLQCTAGRCAPQAQKDQACDEAKFDSCDLSKNLLCIPNASAPGGVCKDLLYAKIGEKCGWDATARTQTGCTASHCSNWEGAGTCGAFVKDGGDCSAATGGYCELFLACRDTRCVPSYPASCQQ